VERYEAYTDLCPRDACEPRPGQPLRQAIRDSVLVYGHRILPAPLRDDLTPIDNSWGSFGDGLGEEASPEDIPEDAVFSKDNPLARYRAYPAEERDPLTQARRLVEQALTIDATPAMHFVHIVSPHSPWSVTPWGTRVMEPWPKMETEDPGLATYDWGAKLRYQPHSLQVGSVDTALGDVIDHLEQTGVWDDATLVVTADHGTSTLPPDYGREITDANVDEVLRVPLFIKGPGQTDAQVIDDVALTIDVVPTLIDLLGIRTDWDLEGHSLLDGSPPTVEPPVPATIDPLLEVVRRHEADFPLGDDWTALAAVGEHAALVGRPAADFEVGAPSELVWSPNNRDAFASLPDERGAVPQVLSGVIVTPDGSEPPALVVVANGTVAGVTGGYRPADGGWAFSATLGPFLVDGPNRITAHQVVIVDGKPVLRALP
jgi:hypothetical protein